MAATLASGVQPEKILKELASLWSNMAKGDSQGVNSGVLRACAMTLVVAAEDDDDAAAAGESLGLLMHEHPSRAIVLRPSPREGQLDARVFAQCWMPFGKRQQICCEQIEITASMDRIAEVKSVILGIMAPDLPMVLWVRGRKWLDQPDFAGLFPLAFKLIIDSGKVGDGDPFHLIRTLQPQVKRFGDLAWTLLTSFREIVARTFEDHGLVSKLARVRSIEVEYTSRKVAAAYLAGWFKRACPDAAVSVHEKLGDSDRVLLKGEGVDVYIELGPPMLFRINGTEHRAMLPVPTEVSMMSEELSMLRRDRIYEAALEWAEKL